MKKTMSIEGMSCGHCTGRVTKALAGLDGVEVISVSVEEKNAIVEHADAVTNELLKETVEDQGFDVLDIK